MLHTALALLLLLAVAAWPTAPHEADIVLPPGLSVRVPEALAVDEEQPLRVQVAVEGGGTSTRVFVEGLPPGATWDEATRTLAFRPDFIQGGQRYPVDFLAVDGARTARARSVLEVRDTLHPPPPRMRGQTRLPGCVRVELDQPTDTWLDSPGYAGRAFPAVVTVPLGASASTRLPVVVSLHGVGAWPPKPRTETERFFIEPSDPFLTYWWGYSERLPGAPPEDGRVPPYTQRRVLALLEWVLRTYPGADPERVYVEGASMGGAGALALGLLHARHFAGVYATHAETVARSHRPTRVAQLSALWGLPEKDLPDGEGLGVWTRLDMTRALRDEPEARSQHLTLVHGKDDPIIHFGAAVRRSALTGQSFYETLEAGHVGHFAAWDEGGHLTADPWLGARWWASEWSRLDMATSLRRDRAFAAFTHSSWDGDPGTGVGNGHQPWRADAGFAGRDTVPGDTGWDGDIHGTLNGGLHWDVARLVDTPERFELPLRAVRGPGDIGLPLVDVTPRRVRGFRCLPGERVHWTFGHESGVVSAGPDGTVTVPGLRLRESWTPLVLEREPN